MEVTNSADFKRVSALPRRRIKESDAAAAAKHWTVQLRAPGSVRILNPWQGLSISEVLANRGAYIALAVGQGKTDITYLLPTALGADRSVLIVPGRGLVEKSQAEFGKLRKYWRAPRNGIKALTSQELSRESGEATLRLALGYRRTPGRWIAPTGRVLLMIDECDDLANPEASAVRRIDRIVVELGDRIVVVCLTGTPGRLSIMNYWHHLGWCLRGRAPVPKVRSVAESWAAALDEEKDRAGYRRTDPGVLGGSLAAARRWYLRRLSETPGVVIVDGDSAADVPLEIRIRLAKEDPVLDREFKLFLRGDIKAGRPPLLTPSGNSVSDPLSRWRYDGQLGCGFFTFYDPPPPVAWRLAQRAKNDFVRRMISRSQTTARPIETEAQVFRRYPDSGPVADWREIRDEFDADKHTRARWLSDSVIQSVRAWVSESDDPGIVWVGAVELGDALMRALRLPYYGPKGVDQSGRSLHAADARRSMVASWHANKRGFNLQSWTRQLVVMPPQSAKYLEQIFGRSHRQGQTKAVTIDVLATSGGTLDSFERAIEEASFARDTVGMTQKILRARVRRATPKLTATNRYRWSQKAG